MENTNQITVAKLFEVLKKHLVWIILAAVVFGCGAAVYGQFFIKAVYTSRTVCVLSDLSEYTSTELSNMPKYVYDAILKLGSTPCVKRVVEEANITAGDGASSAVSMMKSATTFTTNSNNSGFVITVTTTKPEVSYAMIRTYEDLLPEFIESYGLKSLEVIEPVQNAPTSPANGRRSLRYGLVAAAIGAVLCYLIFLVHDLLDVTIRSEHDLRKYVDLPILGLIPQYSGEIESGEKIIKKNEAPGASDTKKE